MTELQYVKRMRQKDGSTGYQEIVPELARFAEGLVDSTRAVVLSNLVLKEEIAPALLVKEKKNIGSTAQPVFFREGVPTACGEIPSLSGNNTFQGSNTYTGAVTFNGAVSIPNGMSALTVGGHDLTKAVTTDEPQTITGRKDFSNLNISTSNGGFSMVNHSDSSSSRTPSELKQNIIVHRAEDESINSMEQHIHNSDGSKWYQYAITAQNGNHRTVLVNGCDSNGNALTSSNMLVTRGDVSATDGITNNLVHTIGNEGIWGDKHFHNYITVHTPNWATLNIQCDLDKNVNPDVTTRVGGISFNDANGVNFCMLGLDYTEDGKIQLFVDGVKRNGDYFRSPNIFEVQL